MQNININDFLKNYWQKKPLLIRAAFPNYQSPINAEELAGLACEDFVESRIILENKTKPKWALENGPFLESRFSKLPKSHWTLLIQGINNIYPELDDLLHEFNFIPSWRVDDLMASYAAPDGSVGPHLDQYDVFLLQASGKRKWMINSNPIEDYNFDEDTPLKIISDFESDSEWVLEAGDMLYLPANVAHYGIGLEDCITFSIGFRAPSHAELLTAYIDDNITELNEELRFQDPPLSANNNCGEISSSAIDNIQDMFLSQFNDKEKIADWFGQYITEYLNDYEIITNENISLADFLDKFKNMGYLRRPAALRANYHINTSNQIHLYINGIKQYIPSDTKDIVVLFCNKNIINHHDLNEKLLEKKSIERLFELYNQGYLEFPNE